MATPYFSEQMETFHSISLDIKNKKTVQEALDLAVKPDIIEGFRCEGSNSAITVQTRLCISKLPPVLILHLKRFEYDFDVQQKLKLNDYIEFPSHICMRPWTKEGLSTSTQEKDKNDSEQKPSSYYEYDLVGVLVHSGTADAGHYYSFIKDRNFWQLVRIQ